MLGCLLEKEQATPDYYPLTVNALVAACNQRSNRYPVLSLSEREVRLALKRLHEEGLVFRDDHGRATRWGQKVERRWGLGGPQKAALTVLLLRGPQTAGEVRNRTQRLHELDSVDEAESALADLASPPDPLVMLLEREPGQKEPRWDHCVGAEESEPSTTAASSSPSPSAREAASPGPDFDPERVMLRLKRLEQQVDKLQAEVRRLRGETD